MYYIFNGIKIIYTNIFKFHMNVAMKDSTDGWKENVYVIMSRKACTTYKNLLGKQWAIYLNTFGITNQNCPIRPVIFYPTIHLFSVSI